MCWYLLCGNYEDQHLFGEVLDDAVLRHLGTNGKAALQLFLNAGEHLLVLLRGEALHTCTHSSKQLTPQANDTHKLIP